MRNLNTAKPIVEASQIDFKQVELLEEFQIWDLRGWRDVDPVNIHDEISPIVLKSTIRLIKHGAIETYSIQAHTSGLEIYSRSDSHPTNFRVFESEDRKDRVNIGKNILKPRLLEIDISKEPIGEEFSIKTTRTYWNAFQSPKQKWVGVTVRQTVLKISFLVYFSRRETIQ